MLSYLLSFTVHILVMQRAQTTTPMAVYTYSGVSCNKLSNKSTYCTALSIHRDMQCTKLLASITDVHVQTVRITLGKSVIMICQQIYPQINSLRLHYNAVVGVHGNKRVITDRVIYTRDRCSKSLTRPLSQVSHT